MTGLIIVGENSRLDEAPAYRCLVCKAGFVRGQERAYEQHVVRCADRNEEELRERSFREKAPGLFDPFRSGDVELGSWIRAHSAAIVHGRKRI